MIASASDRFRSMLGGMSLAVSVYAMFAGCLTASPTPAAEVPAPGLEEVSAAIGVPLFADTNLWDDACAEVADRLQWPEESNTGELSSYRLYPQEPAKFLGVRPYSEVLQGEAGKPVGVSVVFANKGDFGGLFRLEQGIDVAKGAHKSALKKRVDEVKKDLPKAVDDDAKALEAALTALFGQPTKDKLGESGQMRERVLRWDWNGHAFLLAAKKDEYVALRVLPSADVDAPGTGDAPRNAALKKMLQARVQKRPNGDVIIGKIPMVDQGEKGYCAPATMERMMRYMGVPADMYIIAMTAETEQGGGTTVKGLTQGVNDQLRRYRRSLERVSGAAKASAVAKTIDDGYPILWAILVDPELDAALTDRMAQRAQTPDIAIWKGVLKDIAKGRKKTRPDRDRGHICMIIGYNKETGELAISDSWGPEYAERWITEDEARDISRGEMMIIK